LNNPTSDAGTDRPPAFFYGWVVIAVGFITLGIAFGIWYSYSVFFLSIVKDFGWANRDWTLAKALRTRRFWFLAATFSSIAFAYQGTLLHSVSAMVDSGLTRQTAAAYFGLLGIAGSAGKIMFGYLSDRFGRERASTVGGILAIVGIFCLLNATATSTLLPMLFALLFGLGYGAAAPLLPSISADIFIGKSFGRIFAMIGIGGGAGGALGSFLCGMLRDVSGGYTLPLTLCMLSLFLACMFIWLASPRKVRQMVKNNALKTRNFKN